ncbi:MAG: signal peptidase [Nocardioidaceae bacterium]|nr:signal peptidase [Nocardioidaceae bacterium]
MQTREGVVTESTGVTTSSPNVSIGARGALMIKRVVAEAGQRVGIADGVLVVAGHHVHENYVDPATVDGTYFGPVEVPRGSVFVMGDARAGSVDSRIFGAVPRTAIVGRVVRRLW